MHKNSFSRRSFIQRTAATGALIGLSSPLVAQQRQMTIISNRGNADQRAALEAIAAEFGQQASVNVTVNNMDHEAHKTAIRNYLVASPPDVCFWFSGERMRDFVSRDLFMDVSDLIAEQGWAEPMGASIDAVTVDGRQYGLPTGGILWGLYYLQSTFDEIGLTAPTTSEELFAFGEAAREAGMDPISIGTKDMWPAAGWFDHMNLRINGLDQHMALMRGEVPYTDASIVNVMEAWAEQVNANLFSANMTSYAWEPAAAAVAQKRAAMMDLGNFIKYGFPEEMVSDIRYAPFPTYDQSLGRFEDFSLDSMHIPQGASNPEVAKEFLAYFYQPENLRRYLEPEGNVPARSDVETSDHMVQLALEALPAVDGTAQYYDRDTNPEVAQAGMKGFQEFMVRPERSDRILQDIETVRARVFG